MSTHYRVSEVYDIFTKSLWDLQIFVISCVHHTIHLVGKKLQRRLEHAEFSFNKIVLHLPCLQAPLNFNILYHFHIVLR